MDLTTYENTLLEGWEDVHKKSQLTLWILLALKQGAKHMGDIKDTVEQLTKGSITADDKSMYRALRRFNDADIVAFRLEKSNAGPDKKVYYLTDIGKRVLDSFISRNITSIFYTEHIRSLLR